MSSEVMVKIEQGRAVGLTASDAETLNELEGGAYRAVLTVPRGRSVPQANVFHDFCGKLAANYEDDSGSSLTKEQVRQILTIEAGHCDIRKVNGLWVRLAKSIAFNAMPQDDFTLFMCRAQDEASRIFGHDKADAAMAEALKLPSTTRDAVGNARNPAAMVLA